MSRIGRQPVSIPDGVSVTVEAHNEVTVKGPKGTLTQRLPPAMQIEQQDSTLVVSRPSDARHHRALHGLTRQLLANMVTGVSEGYEKRLEIQGTGYRAVLQGETLDLQLGFSHPQRFTAPEGIEFEVPDPTHIRVRGIDKQLVGRVAADLRRVRPADPYKGKGMRYEGEYVRRKPGKAAVSTVGGI
jgi:large subunit ribosomal protein L6